MSLALRDAGCRDCQNVTSGDCGKHGPRSMTAQGFAPTAVTPLQTRTTVLLAAITKEFYARKAHLDTARDIGEITVTLKLAAGTNQIKAVEFTELQVVRRLSDRIQG